MALQIVFREEDTGKQRRESFVQLSFDPNQEIKYQGKSLKVLTLNTQDGSYILILTKTNGSNFETPAINELLTAHEYLNKLFLSKVKETTVVANSGEQVDLDIEDVLSTYADKQGFDYSIIQLERITPLWDARYDAGAYVNTNNTLANCYKAYIVNDAMIVFTLRDFATTPFICTLALNMQLVNFGQGSKDSIIELLRSTIHVQVAQFGIIDINQIEKLLELYNIPVVRNLPTAVEYKTERLLEALNEEANVHE